jgi:hypothetical protein
MGLYVEGDLPVVANGNCGNGMFGNNGDWIWAFLLFALIGNNGWGGFGGGNGGVGSNYVLATDFATIERKLDGVNNGLCDGFYAQNTNMLNGFASVQQTLCQGFSGVNASITDVGYSIKDCCCQTQRAIDGVNFNIATQFGNLNSTLCGLGRDIIENQNANYRALHDEIVANKIEAKNERIAELTMQLNRADLRASQEAQNAYLLSELKGCPKPAFIVPNPNCCYQYNVAPACGCASVQ